VIWPLSLHSLLSCGYANMGKINFFHFFGCTLGGVGNWVQHSFFHCLLRILRTLYGWNFVFGSQFLHHLSATWNVAQIQIFRILLHSQAWISQSLWLIDLPNFLCSASAMLAVRKYKFLLFIWPTAQVLLVWNVKKIKIGNIFDVLFHILCTILLLYILLYRV